MRTGTMKCVPRLLLCTSLAAGCGGLGAHESTFDDEPVAAASDDLRGRPTVEVDLGNKVGVITHHGSGFLHGLSATVPSRADVEPLSPSLLRGGPLIDGKYTNGFDLYTRARAMGATLESVLSDGFSVPPFPGDRGDFSRWQWYVALTARAAHDLGMHVHWDIWNEPDQPYSWHPQVPDPTHSQFFATWRYAVAQIRQQDRDGVIVGPSLSSFDSAFLTAFLDDTLMHGAAPDVLSWHENGDDPSAIPAHVEWARAQARARGIRLRGVEINETIGPSRQFKPGGIVWFLANLERAGVSGATKACWHDPDVLPGVPDMGSNCNDISLDGLLKPDHRSRRSVWWAYRLYAMLQGERLHLPDAGGFDGLAALDGGHGSLRVLLGNHTAHALDGGLRLLHARAPSFLRQATHVRVVIERIHDSESAAVSYETPPVVADRVLPIDGNDEVRVALPTSGAWSALAVHITRAR